MKMPGEFIPKVINIGIDNCRSILQYYYAKGGNKYAFAKFKGHVADISPTKGYLFIRLYIKFNTYDWRYGNEEVKDYEDHVWIYDAQPFKNANIKVGDNVQFSALVYAYHRKNGTKDYSLKAPQEIKKIKKYELPIGNKGFSDSFYEELVCETCIYTDHCYGEPCLAPEGYKKEKILNLKINYHLDSVLSEILRLNIAPDDTKRIRELIQERFEDGMMDKDVFDILIKSLDKKTNTKIYAKNLNDDFGPVNSNGDPQGW